MAEPWGEHEPDDGISSSAAESSAQISILQSARLTSEPAIFTVDEPEVWKPVQTRHGRATVTGIKLIEKSGLEAEVRPLSWTLKQGREIPEVDVMTTAFAAAQSQIAEDRFAARPALIPIHEILPWVIFVGLLLLLAIYFVGVEQGATSLIRGMYVHEYVHDSRHLLGFPCH